MRVSISIFLIFCLFLSSCENQSDSQVKVDKDELRSLERRAAKHEQINAEAAKIEAQAKLTKAQAEKQILSNQLEIELNRQTLDAQNKNQQRQHEAEQNRQDRIANLIPYIFVLLFCFTSLWATFRFLNIRLDNQTELEKQRNLIGLVQNLEPNEQVKLIEVAFKTDNAQQRLIKNVSPTVDICDAKRNTKLEAKPKTQPQPSPKPKSQSPEKSKPKTELQADKSQIPNATLDFRKIPKLRKHKKESKNQAQHKPKVCEI